MSADNWADCPKCGDIGEFREDYDIGVYEKEFGVNYAGRCRGCGFEFFFNRKLTLEEMIASLEGRE